MIAALLGINLKVNMPLHLLKISFASVGIPGPEPVAEAAPWSIYASCEEQSALACGLFQKIRSMPATRDRKDALACLRKLIQVAASGRPLTVFYDKKQCHEIHSFHHDNRERTIWRIRHNDIRLAFYYAEGRLIFLCHVFTKREDKLNEQQKLALEAEAKRYIDAEKDGTLKPFSAAPQAGRI